MKLKKFGFGLIAALACTSVLAQSNGHKGAGKAQNKIAKPLNQADIDFQQRVIDASKAYQAGNTDEALKQFEQLYSEKDNHEDICSWLGFLYLRTNQADKAIPALEKATQMKPDDQEAWNNLGNAYMMANMPEKALGSFQKVADGGGPSVFEAEYNIGTIFLHRKDYDQSIAMLNKAALLRPNDPYVLNNLGVAYEGANQNANAAKAFARASDLKSDNKTFAKNAGFSYYRQHMYSEAIPYLSRYANLDSSDSVVEQALSDAYLKTDKREAAAKYYEDASGSQNDNADFWYNLGVLRMSMKNRDGAEVAYQKSLAIDPNNANSLNNLGILYFNEGKYQDAEATFDKLMGVGPKPDLQAKINFASSACKAGDMSRAIPVWKQILQTNPERTDVELSLADALWINKDYEGARFHYVQVLHRDSGNAEALNGIGLWYLQNSRLADAKTSFQGSIHGNPGNALAYNNLAVTLERMNQRKQAINLLEKANKMAPDNKQIQDNLKRMKAAG